MQFLELGLIKEDVLVSGVRSAMSKSADFAAYETDVRQVVSLLQLISRILVIASKGGRGL